ncbi:complex I subunit 4 family protein [Planctomicrobium sp. SH668]|uniref:complex I subunit 4 family protein n=1 Tax=Planctomicrobium sp. SH668 TaxID=3448126 RepID=UPI003F5B672E
MVSILFLCLSIPLLTALALTLFRSSLTGSNARWVALAGSIATTLMATQLVTGYSALPKSYLGNGPIQPQVEYKHSWLTLNTANASEAAEPVKLEFYFGLDGVSVALIALSTLLILSAVLISWNSVKTRSPEFFAAIMVLEAGLVGVFSAFDVILFYAFFELTLIPLFFLISIWGGNAGRQAAVKFFLYTLAGSFITLLGVVTLITHVASHGLATPTSIPAIAEFLKANPLSVEMQTGLFLAISAGFLVKVPVFPFHTWLPLAYTEAPIGATVLLSGILAKLGTYGFLRLCLPMFPDACLQVGVPLIGAISVIGIIYGSLAALVQNDLKRLVAYSSIAHLGFCTLGLFALNAEGVTGSVLQMVNHGLATGALFLIVGMIAERYNTLRLSDLGGLAARLPLIGCAMVFITMASIGLPGLNGFTGEFLSLAGMFKQHALYGILGTTGVILAAWYLLTAVQTMFFGPLKETTKNDAGPSDMSLREFFAILPLAIGCLWIGVTPAPLVNLIKPDIVAVSNLYLPDAATEQASTDAPTRDSVRLHNTIENTVAAAQAQDTMMAKRSSLSGNGN